MRDALYLAFSYLRSSWGRSTTLVGGVVVAAFLPLFTFVSAEVFEDALLRRAETSPILIGAKGNEFDLTMSSLYFRGRVSATVPFATTGETGHYGLTVPLYVAYTAAGSPVVGTTLEYFHRRGLVVETGRLPALLGEVVAGAEVARRLELEPGDSVRSDLVNLYNLAGAYPVLLEVVGVLESAGTADDGAFFGDLKTTWLLDGRLHGHSALGEEDVLNPEADEGENLEATAAIFLFTELDDRNLESFHLHGDPGEAPVTSTLVFPRDRRAHDQLLGDFALHETLQAVRPTTVLDTVLAIVLRLREGLSAYFVLVAGSTLAFFVLVVSLSLRLRRAELRLLRRIGCSRRRVAAILGAEIAIVIFAGVTLTAVLTVSGVALLRSLLGL